MATTNLIAADSGSESEEETFNPAPAVESDHESAAGDEDPVAVQRRPSREEEPQRHIQEQDYDEDEDDAAGRRKADGHENGLQGGRDEEDDHEGNEGPNGDKLNGEHDEDDDDEEDEEEDEDEEEVSGHRRKRARRVRGNQFLDVEAEVDEDEDDVEDEDDELPHDGFIADTHPDDLADLPAGSREDDRGHRELDRRRELELSLDAEKQAAAYVERYGRTQRVVTDSVVVPKRLLLPSVENPSIWGVRCRPGKEKEVVFAIMKRIDERELAHQPLAITSALERGGTMTGYVYVEARKQADIMAALDGISNVFIGPKSKMVLVPIKEMPDLLRTTKSKTLEPGQYVRLKRTKYQGDLAQIEEVEQNGLEVSLRIIPRLDYGLNEDANAPMIDGSVRGEAAKRKRQGGLGLNNPATRPPQRLFSEAEAKKKHQKHLQQVSTLDKRHWTYLGDTYISGFLIKDVKIQNLITENVNPTLEEVTKFAAGAEDGTENLDLAALAASLKSSTANSNYLPGDMVEVYEGEQKGVCGKAISVVQNIITLNVTEGELRGQTIDVPVKGLRKRFREGDHVKVIGGSRFRDEVGMVVRIADDRVTLLSDAGDQEITVFSKDLREASDSGVAGGVGNYDVYDLVQLDPATVGCVTKVDRESLRILDQNGSMRSVIPSQISNKLEKRRHAVATDRNGSEIRTEDTVREVAGEQKQGKILHIYRSYLFLQNREQAENSGVMVVRTTNVATVAAKGGRVTGAGNAGPDLTKMNPAAQRNGGSPNGNVAMAPPKSLGRDRALGQTVTIGRGPYKGLLGVVKDTTDLEARVELHTKGKTITVPKDTLRYKDKLTGQTISIDRFGGGRGRGDGGRGGFGGATPARNGWDGGRTPIATGTSRTPAWSASSRTPAWAGGAASGGRTPAWAAGASGGRTPAYGGDGSRTVNPYGSRTAYGGESTWAPGSRTPFGQQGSNDAFSAGSKTPAYGSGDSWGAGSKTPAYGGSGDGWGAGAPSNGDSWGSSNRGYEAPSPANAASAPTPAGYNAPTPAAYTPGDSAPSPAAASTPYASYGSRPTARGNFYDGAPTPAGIQVETPGNWGGADDEPRYSENTPSP
ncbi:MAG: transcription elongation factor spt5 [Candelina submexicana]|nr:MAG: transcription elongation factor spt5 [Candelina submexicana]